MKFYAGNNTDIELSIFNDDVPRNLIVYRDTGGIGIKCNGRVIVKTAKAWHEAAALSAQKPGLAICHEGCRS